MQSIVLDDELRESNHVKFSSPKVIPLMSSWNHKPSPNRDIEKFAHHMLFSFSSRIEEYLKSPPITGTYFQKLREPGVLGKINRNRDIMEPLSDVVDEVLLNLQSNLDGFPQKDENQEEIVLIVNGLLDNENS